VVRVAAPVLRAAVRPRTSLASLVAAVFAVLLYDHLAERLPRTSLWPAAIEIVLVAVPLTFLPVLGVLALIGGSRLLAALLAVPLVLLAIACTRADLVFEASVAKAMAAALVGLVAASAIGSPMEVVLLALVVIGVDAYSVFAGPTKAIIAHHPDVLDAFTIEMPGPGGRSAALGVTDVFFYGLLLASVVRYGLRVRLSALAMLASFGVTYLAAVGFDRALPALPLLSLAFLAVNADLLAQRR
jgi:hypothetical protein